VTALAIAIAVAALCSCSLLALRWWLAFRREERPAPALPPQVVTTSAALQAELDAIRKRLTDLEGARAFRGR
jgi:hypothetical protein